MLTYLGLEHSIQLIQHIYAQLNKLYTVVYDKVSKLITLYTAYSVDIKITE